MLKTMNNQEKGFTLIELMIALAVGALIMTAVYASMNMAQRSATSVGRKVVTQQDARTVLDVMSMEVRMASYNPNMSSPNESGYIWSGSALGNCSSVNLITANKGIQAANATTIAIAMDLGGRIDDAGANVPSGRIGDAENEYIVYMLDNQNKTITRNVSCSGNSVILGGEDLSTVIRNGDTNTPLFEYFDRNNNTLPEPVSIPDIRRVKITIVADTKDPDMLSGQAKRMNYTTDILVKNHVLSP